MSFSLEAARRALDRQRSANTGSSHTKVLASAMAGLKVKQP
jgi:hypothetical protein